MKLIDKFKTLINENSQFIAGIIFTGGVALLVYFFRHQIIFLGRSFWSLAEVFALPVTLLIIYWLYQNKSKAEKRNDYNVIALERENQWIIDWRRDLKTVAAKDKLTLDDVYVLRASVWFAPKKGEALSSYDFMTKDVISFCEELVAKYQDNTAEVVWLKDDREREQIRVYSRYLLKAEFELTNNDEDQGVLEKSLENVQVTTVSLLQELKELDEKV